MFRKTLKQSRYIFNSRYFSTEQHPFVKTWDLISKDFKFLGSNKKPFAYPEHADIVIIGGGFIGSSVAYWLKTRAGEGLSVIVIEKDVTFQGAQKNVSLGNISQHYSLPENVSLSQYGVEFLRNSKELLNSEVNIKYCPVGHLLLASEKYTEQLEKNVEIHKERGIKNELLTPDKIRHKFPWINTNDITLGCIGAESEGYFDSWNLLQGLIKKCQELGTIYINGEVTDFVLEKQRDVLMEGVKPGAFNKISKVLYKTPNNEEYDIKFAACVLATGAKSEEVGQLAKIGISDGLLSVPLPIQERHHKVFSVACSEKIGLNTPVVTDTSGLWFRRNGLKNNFICGLHPLLLSDTKDLSEKDYYSNLIEPLLINRVPQIKKTEVNCVASEIFGYNTYDDSGIVGPHPYHNNLYLATGFGMNGCLHAPAIGRAITELIIDGNYTTIDLIRFGFDRLLIDEPLIESNVY